MGTHFKKIGILIGGGGLLIYVAATQQTEIMSNHGAPDASVAVVNSSLQAEGSLGFAVAPPVGFTAKNDGNGILLVQDGQIRTPLTVRIVLKDGVDLPDATDERRIASGLARYKIQELQGGSAGPHWQLNAIKETPKGGLMMQAALQAELGPPDFAKAWEIFENVQIAP